MDYIAHVRENGERQSLRDHLRGVGEKASTNAAKIGLGAHGELIGLLHDLGKYSDAFQVYLKSATGILNQDEDEEFVDADKLRGRIDHSTAGAQLVWREGIYVSYGSINPQLAERTGFAAEDAAIIKAILPKLLENDASSARPEGSMEVLQVIWWQHPSKSGVCSSDKVHRSLSVDDNGSVTVAEIEGLTAEIIDGF